MARVRFGMNKKTIKALLQELDDCNMELDRFTEKSLKIETYRKSVKPAFATRLQRIQSYAKSLHGSLLWTCTCKSSHKTSLQLEPRGNLFSSGGMKKTSKTSFHVSFTTTSTADDIDWSWQAAEIHVEEEDWLPTPVSPPKPK
jgi:cysteine sulfinate desulfinase/cysteine desulfurase-like protein